MSEIQPFAVNIMPLDDSPWDRRQCSYKLIQYIAAGLPTVASPVGVNSQIVEYGVTGFLASTPEEWQQSLVRLRDNPTLRKRMGMAGRKMVEASYILRLAAPVLAALLHKAA